VLFFHITETDRQTDKQTHTHIHTERDTHRKREKERERERKREKERERGEIRLVGGTDGLVHVFSVCTAHDHPGTA